MVVSWCKDICAFARSRRIDHRSTAFIMKVPTVSIIIVAIVVYTTGISGAPVAPPPPLPWCPGSTCDPPILKA
ncbi:hypothetical protein BDV93DRAFT_554419 [Ceratobasidium sp. AG-I]|nr:hypothetical protein BDV93DRAFT_554419 [Ceratobasidium sp. AG-I]